MSTKLMVRNARLSYEHIFQADSIGEDATPKFSAQLIIRKDDPQVETIKSVLLNALKEKFPGKVKGNTWPAGYHNPLKDGDEMADEHPEYEGCLILSASSKTRPLVIDRKKRPVAEEDGVIYSGCYCNFSLAASGFDYKNKSGASIKKGVTVYLNGVQFVKDGERFGADDASSDFDELDDDNANGGDYDDLL